MWTAQSEQLARGRSIKVSINFDSAPTSYAEVLHLWQNDSEFRTFFVGLLAACPFSAFRWETPPITSATANRPFEFVLLDSPGLGRTPDASAFAEHFSGSSQVVEFANLGKDAIMVLPCPHADHSAYGHIGAFVRHAPEPQIHALWQMVGSAMQCRLSTTPVWLSTAGAGVSWLHVRLDDRPKYYGHEPYRSVD